MIEWLNAPVTNATMIIFACLFAMYEIYLDHRAEKDAEKLVDFIRKNNK